MKQYKENDPLLIENFDYSLPDERIAKYPLATRDDSKLLLYKGGVISTNPFYQLPDLLPPNSMLVYNNTKVIEARISFRKITGSRIEIFCLEPLSPADYTFSLGATETCSWKCMIGNLKKWKDNKIEKPITIGDVEFVLIATKIMLESKTHIIQFSWNAPQFCFAQILEAAGELPIPPYLNRKTEECDLLTYQTVYSKIKGSVAAPTAGLHFTERVFTKLNELGVLNEEVTLHVGAGTFQPVKVSSVTDHTMHTEVVEVRKQTVESLLYKSNQVIAVGTTSVRTLESLYYVGCMLLSGELVEGLHSPFFISQWYPYERKYSYTKEQSLKSVLHYLVQSNLDVLHAETQILIKPGYEFKMINGMITNFHQPKSTLLLLVSAFVGNCWKDIYDYALENNFRFLSYGDSSLLLK